MREKNRVDAGTVVVVVVVVVSSLTGAPRGSSSTFYSYHRQPFPIYHFFFISFFSFFFFVFFFFVSVFVVVVILFVFFFFFFFVFSLPLSRSSCFLLGTALSRAATHAPQHASQEIVPILSFAFSSPRHDLYRLRTNNLQNAESRTCPPPIHAGCGAPRRRRCWK